MTTNTPTEAVMAIGKINLTGNVIPTIWYKRILLPSGLPDQTAITLLAEIVYWYRPREVRSEETGEVVGYRKRFHGDKLQRSYQAFAEQFGFSKRAATDALKRLEAAGLITKDLRTVQMAGGMVLSNVLFVEPVAGAINDISSMTVESGSKNVTPVPFQRNTPSKSTEPLLHPDVEGLTLKRETYTEITTEITTEIKKPIGADAVAPTPMAPAKQEYPPEFEEAWSVYPKRHGGNSKQAGWKAWNARLRQGVKPEAMLAGVKRYAAFLAADGKIGTAFVKQASTFFGPDRHFDEEWGLVDRNGVGPGGDRAFKPTYASVDFSEIPAGFRG